MTEALISPLAWMSPFGVGFFLVCLGVFIWLVTKNSKYNSK